MKVFSLVYKNWRSLLVVAFVSALPEGVVSFAPQGPGIIRSSSSSSSSSSATALHISSWGTKGPPAFRQRERLDPAKNIQDYLPEPGPVEARSNVDGAILVSGLVNRKSSSDQFLFDLLNHQDSAFEFETITAFCDDAAVAKKRLLSRSARYTGLLDKLRFVQADAPGALPTPEQLTGIKTWLAVLSNDGSGNSGATTSSMLAQCHEIANTVAAVPTLANVAILLTGANELDAAECQATVDRLANLASSSVQYTIVAVGTLDEDRPEGSAAYHYQPWGTVDGVLPPRQSFSRQEAYRLVTELLQLECGVNTAYAFAEVYNVNVTEVKLIKGLREAGYARPQEIDHMIRLGPKAYKDAIEAYRKENPDAALGYTTNAWWEAEEYQQSRRRSDERMAATAQAVKDARTIEIEAVAKEWAKREYFRASMAGTVPHDQTEDEFIVSVWDRAMFEGDLKFRQTKGEVVDETTELANFQAQQERKQQVMLKRAKAELAEILQEDTGDDLQLPRGTDDDEDDDDE